MKLIYILKEKYKKGMIMNKKDYPKDIDKKSWDKMTNFTLNMLALATTLGAVAIILGVAIMFNRWLT